MYALRTASVTARSRRRTYHSPESVTPRHSQVPRHTSLPHWDRQPLLSSVATLLSTDTFDLIANRSPSKPSHQSGSKLNRQLSLHVPSRSSSSVQSDGLLRLNIGGTPFMLARSSIEKYPDTLLAKLLLYDRDEWSEQASCYTTVRQGNELFFDRPGHLFAPIAQFYQTGSIHRSPGLCAKAFRNELSFWGILPNYTQGCCHSCVRIRRRLRPRARRPLRSAKVLQEEDIECNNDGSPCRLPSRSRSARTRRSRRLKESPTQTDLLEDTDFLVPHLYEHQNSLLPTPRKIPEAKQGQIRRQSTYRRCQNEVWNNIEANKTNSLSMCFNMASILFILINLSLIILDSLPGYHYNDYITQISAGAGIHNETANGTDGDNKLVSQMFGKLSYQSVIGIYSLDWLCTSVFTLELLTRLWSTPNRCQFLKQPMTIIDILSVFPAYVEAIANAILSSQVQGLEAVQVLRALRTFRVFRVLKLARFQSSFQIIGKCMTESVPEFILLFFHLSVATLVFGSLLYYIELAAPPDSDTPYKTIPDAVYWSVVTYFSYSDAPPVTVMGKTVATAASILGIVLMALPVSVVVDKFSHYFAEARRMKKEMRRMKKQNGKRA